MEPLVDGVRAHAELQTGKDLGNGDLSGSK